MSEPFVHLDQDGDGRHRHLLAGPEEGAALPLTGVRALMFAILDDAMRAYLGPVPRAREEAEQWVHHVRGRHVFAFETVCETLGFEPGAVRAALRRRQRRGLATLDPVLLRRTRARPNGRSQSGFQLMRRRPGAGTLEAGEI